jgi:L-alanine-DL-glutamate epimerase-like enolase superfamily enzyme
MRSMPVTAYKSSAAIESVEVAVYRVPTDLPEADGTFAWDSTTIVIVQIAAGGEKGMGYTYADAATARVIADLLADRIRGLDALDIPTAYQRMTHAIRNLGRPGICSMAISGVDAALWDQKAKLLGVPLATLLGRARDAAPVYGSGGFTSYSIDQLELQLSGWLAAGIPRVKMKVGTHPADDIERVRAARKSIGKRAELFVDANGAYSRKQALAMAEQFADLGVSWFEEPVSSDDLAGLRLLRDRAPAGMDIAAGEYGYDADYFRAMLEAGAVDCLQADATRCGGISGFLQASAIARAFHLDLSAHCAPALHLHLGCALLGFRHLEYFHDHARIEQMFFDGAIQPIAGQLRPDLSRSGLGLELKRADIEKFRI